MLINSRAYLLQVSATPDADAAPAASATARLNANL